jgi:hypothetical protein
VLVYCRVDIIISLNVTSSGNEIAEHIPHLTLKSIIPRQVYSHVVEKRLNFKTEKQLSNIVFLFFRSSRNTRSIPGWNSTRAGPVDVKQLHNDTADVKQVPFWKVVVVTSHVKNSQSAGSGGCILPPNYW